MNSTPATTASKRQRATATTCSACGILGMQMLTVPEILAEDRFTTPSVAARSVVAPRLPGT